MWPEDDEIDAALRGDYAQTEVNRSRIIVGVGILILAIAMIGFMLSASSSDCIEQIVCSIAIESLK